MQNSPLQKHINCGSRLPSKKISAHRSRLSFGDRVRHILSVALRSSSFPSIDLAHQPDGQVVIDIPLFSANNDELQLKGSPPLKRKKIIITS